MARIDSGHLIFTPFEERVSYLQIIQISILTHRKVYAVGTVHIVQEGLQASTGYGWRVGVVPLETLPGMRRMFP